MHSVASILSFRARHFREHPQGYELDSSIRSTVHFLQASVLDPHLLEESPPYDVVFCRNLLIYLGVSARVCVSAAIERLLAADGVLFIGHADRLDVSGVRTEIHGRWRPGLLCLSPAGAGQFCSPLVSPST